MALSWYWNFEVWTLELGWKWKFGTIWWKVGVGLELIQINLNSIQLELR
jgi:hypothetical protein